MGTFRNWPPPIEHTLKRTGKPTFKKPKKPKGGGGGGFTDPTDLAGLVLWLDGSDITTLFEVAGSQPWGVGTTPVTADDDTVASWLDKSGQDNHVNQSGANNEPTYKTNIQNGLSVLRGIAAAQDDYLFSTESVLSQDANVTIFYVAAATVDNSFGTVFSNTDTAALRMFSVVDSRTSDKEAFIVIDSTGQARSSNVDDVGTEFNQFTSILDNPDITPRLNGTAGTTLQVAGDGVTANDYTRVFSQFNTTSPLVGDLGELVVYDRTLNMGEINKVESYLKDKWATP